MKRRPAFTLIELLVVIAIIALLLGIIMPAISKAKAIAATAVCLSNIGQMGKAYYMYAEENKGFVTDGKPCLTADVNSAAERATAYFNFVVDGKRWRQLCFVANPMDQTGNFSHQNLQDEIRGLEKGGLWPYLQSPDVYHCPVDTRWRRPPDRGDPKRHAIGGWRSYSIGSVLSAGGYGETGSGENKAVTLKYSEIRSPGDKIVFLEEMDPEGMNDNYWNMYLVSARWWDPVSIVHNGYSTFAYADGHTERHKWTDKNMIKMSKQAADVDLKGQMADPLSDDYPWFRRSYIPAVLR